MTKTKPPANSAKNLAWVPHTKERNEWLTGNEPIVNKVIDRIRKNIMRKIKRRNKKSIYERDIENLIKIIGI